MGKDTVQTSFSPPPSGMCRKSTKYQCLSWYRCCKNPNTKQFYIKRIEQILKRKLTPHERRNSRLTFRNWLHGLQRDQDIHKGLLDVEM